MIGGPGFLPWVPNGAGSLTFMWITIYNQFGWVAPTRHAASSITIHLVDPTLCKDLPKIQLSPLAPSSVQRNYTLAMIRILGHTY